ncbi:hypothetical protein ACFPK1_31750, partial [Actinomycetospora rhizophila]
RDDAAGYGVLDAAAAVRGGPPRTGPGVRAEAPAPPASAGAPVGWIVAGGVAVLVVLGAVIGMRRRAAR